MVRKRMGENGTWLDLRNVMHVVEIGRNGTGISGQRFVVWRRPAPGLVRY